MDLGAVGPVGRGKGADEGDERMTFEHAFLTLMALGFFGFLLLCGVSERVMEWVLGRDEDA